MNFSEKVDIILEGRPEFSIKLIPELRDLYENYWEIRKEASTTCYKEYGYSDPEICQNISPLIAKHLNGKGIETSHVHGERDQILMHDYNETDMEGEAYIVDGSVYQIYYLDDYAELGIRFSKRIEHKFRKTGIVKLNEIIAIIDFRASGITAYDREEYQGYANDCSACAKRAREGILTKCPFCARNEEGRNKTKAAAGLFNDIEIEHIKGRLLPHMLRIEKQDNTSYMKHYDADADDVSAYQEPVSNIDSISAAS